MDISAAGSSKMTASTGSTGSVSKDPWVVVGAPPKNKDLKALDMRVASESKIDKVSKAMTEARATVEKANILQNSIRSGKISVIKYNLKHCDKKIINTKTNQGTKAIHVALACPEIPQKDRLLIVQMLLKKGSDVKDVNSNKEEAVHVAVSYGVNRDIVKLLIAHGADIHAYSALGDNAEKAYKSSNRTSLNEFFN